MDRRRLLAGATVAAAAAATGAAAAGFPARLVRLVVPFPPGGPTDLLGRLLAERLAGRWGQTVVVENRGGGGTVVGTNSVAKAPPDGYTLGVVISAHVVNPALRDDLPYDTLRDFAPVTQLTRAHVVLVANPSLRAADLPEMVDLAKRTPGGLAYASPGIGTITHMAGELLAGVSGAELVHIPYPGSAPAHADLLSGRVPLMFDVWHSVKPHVDAGRLKVLGVASAEPIPGAEALPRIADTYPGFSVASLFGLVAPAGTPRAVVERIASDVRAVLSAPDMAQRVRDLGMEPVGSTPAEFGALLATEIERWRPIIRGRGIRPG
jgi:tripartite-type tricarboxylate transporter receptor subunit TctC